MLEPLRAGKRLLKVGAGGVRISPMYVEDVARATVFLLSVPGSSHDEVGRELFLVDDEPTMHEDLHAEAGRLLATPIRYLRVPSFLFRWMAGPIVHSYMTSHTVYRNDRLQERTTRPEGRVFIEAGDRVRTGDS